MKSLSRVLPLVLLLTLAPMIHAQEKIDSAVVGQIKDEGMNHSQVMDILSYITDVYGPRLTGSPEYTKAAEWALGEMKSIGLENVHFDAWGPLGRGWSLKHYEANVIGRQVFPLVSYPKAWSPGVRGAAGIVYIDVMADTTLESYKGTLKGKYVMIGDPVDVKAHFTPQATRDADSTLLQLANAGGNRPRGGRFNFRMTPEDKRKALLNYAAVMLAQKEGAMALLTPGPGDGGTIFVQQASVPAHPDTPYTKRVQPYAADAPKILPQIAVSAEQYNRLVRMMKRGEHPKLDLDLDVTFTKPDSVYNIIGEIPGSDLKDEIVMLGGHFDSWQGGTGATDNGTGTATCLEALRILKKLDLKPRRTIRVGLWGGEEEGLFGSAAYVKKYLGERSGGGGFGFDPSNPPMITQKPAAEKFSVYFNDDNGAGKFRGIYMQGNDAVRPIFREWLAPFKDMGASTLSLANTGGTDHLSFDAVGLPAFQFIQDELEYGTRTHHSTADVYERVQEDDMKQAAVVMAAFAYQAAVRDQMIPRKPMPNVKTAKSGQ